jgi:hypothetical protein
VKEVLALLNETGAADPARLAATLPLDGTGPCATIVGQGCQVGGALAGSTGTVVSSMAWRIVVPAGLIRPGDAAVVFVPTTRGTEFFRCPPAVAGQPTICTGTSIGNGRQGGTVRVMVGDQLVAQGTINGPGVAAAPPPGTLVPLAPIRIELTWGATPRDLDAHLWVPLPPPAPRPLPSR